ncbi:MAG: hypothetical protein ABI747_00325 [Candidatus Moraniibacteriota bacterium]
MHPIAKLLITVLIEEKKAEIVRTEVARQVSIKDTQEAEGAMISRYDTFLEEAQYLAGGQNKRLLEAKAVVISLEALLQNDACVSSSTFVGSLVTIENMRGSETRKFLLMFDGAGGSIFPSPENENEKITALSVSSPLGKELFRKEVGAEIESPILPGAWEITEIQ